MVDDPVYSEFISPLYRRERLRAERAEARVEQERQRADHYATRLKEAGLLPPE